MHQTELDLAEPAPTELDGEVRCPQPPPLDLLLEGLERLEHAVIAEGQSLQREDLVPHDLAHPGQLLLELRLGGEIPCHGGPPVLFSVGPRDNYRNGMPGDTAATPIRTTVTWSRPGGPRHGAPARSDVDGPTTRARLASAERALLDEGRLLTGDELGALAELPDHAVTSLAALAHQVRLAWCGPEVEVEGILSAKTGGCPEDCHFCSQSSRFDTPVKATPFADTGEVLRAAEETRRPGPRSSASCWPCADRTSAPWVACSSWCP